ncbi:MAG: hypothetical protein ACPGJV_02690 [Bacteriovoracaceae bacterium]
MINNMNIESVNILEAGDAAMVVKLITSPENIQRKKNAITASAISSGGMKPHLMDLVKKKYGDFANKYRLVDASLAKKIKHKKAKAYSEDANREIKGEGLEEASIRYKEICDESDIHESMELFDEFVNDHGYAAFWVTLIESLDEGDDEYYYGFNPLEPWEYDLLGDVNTGKQKVFVITHRVKVGDKEVDEFSMWTNEHFVKWRKIEDKMIQVPIESNPNNVNPIEMLPVAYYAKGRKVGYPIENNIAQQSLEWALGMTELKTSAKDQGKSTLVIEHDSTTKIGDVKLDLKSYIDLEQKPDDGRTGKKTKDSKAYFLTPNPKLVEHRDILINEAIEILDDHGITTKSKMEGSQNVESAISKIVDSADVQHIIAKNQNIYAKKIEPMIFNIVKKYELIKEHKEFQDAKLSVHFSKPRVLMSDKESLEIIKLRADLGLDLPWQKHQLMNPNLSDEEAQKHEEEIQKALKEKEPVKEDEPEKEVM